MLRFPPGTYSAIFGYFLFYQQAKRQLVLQQAMVGQLEVQNVSLQTVSLSPP